MNSLPSAADDSSSSSSVVLSRDDDFFSSADLPPEWEEADLGLGPDALSNIEPAVAGNSRGGGASPSAQKCRGGGPTSNTALYRYRQTAPGLAAMPNIALQGQLFGPLATRGPKVTKKALCHRHALVVFTGELLDGADGDVVERLALLAMQRGKSTEEGMQLNFGLRTLLNALDRRDWKSDRAWLERALKRINEAEVFVSAGRNAFGGALIRLAAGEKPGHFSVVIPHGYYSLLSGGFTTYERDKRSLLRRRPLAFWLFGYLASLLESDPVLDVSELHRLSGCTCSLPEFRRLLLPALGAVQQLDCVIEANQHLEIRNGRVAVTRRLNSEQQSYLAKKERQLRAAASAA